jgi:hypothetical protein
VFNGYDNSDKGELRVMNGIEAVFMGALAVFGGGFYEWIIWLANPLFIFSIILLSEQKIWMARICSMLSVILGVSFFFLDEVLVSESGKTALIQSRGVGYYLWLTSMVVWLFYIVGTKKKYLMA